MPLLPLLAALALALGPSTKDSTEALMGPGVSHALASARAAAIRDVRYGVHLDVTARDTARGQVTVRFTLAARRDVILDFRGPSLDQVTVNGKPVAAEWNRMHLRIPAAALRAGRNQVEARFASRIAPAGASIIRYHDDAERSDYLYTLLVPSDANALFPCFDQPDIKARLGLSLTVPGSWTAIANGVTHRSTPAEGGAVTMHFRETEPLPTYLFAFAAGPWKVIAGTKRPTPLLVRGARLAEVEGDSIQDQVASALDSFERFFGVPYPFQQFQHLLAPAFPFGGMEHPGVTMFNEESFIYREPPTLPQRLGRRATIYHEVAHQWELGGHRTS